MDILSKYFISRRWIILRVSFYKNSTSLYLFQKILTIFLNLMMTSSRFDENTDSKACQASIVRTYKTQFRFIHACFSCIDHSPFFTVFLMLFKRNWLNVSLVEHGVFNTFLFSILVTNNEWVFWTEKFYLFVIRFGRG